MCENTITIVVVVVEVTTKETVKPQPRVLNRYAGYVKDYAPAVLLFIKVCDTLMTFSAG